MRKKKVGSFTPLPIVPIALVGTNVNGKPNYMTVGFVSGVNIKPWIIGVSLNKKHYTPKGIDENGTFSINIPSADYVTETDYCGLVSGNSTDKSKIFSSFYGELETAPMIEEFPITYECRYIDKKIEFATDMLYFGEVHQVYMNENLISENKKIDILKANPLIYGIDNLYRTVGEVIGQAHHIGWNYKPEEKNPISEELSSQKYHCQIIDRSAQPALTIPYKGGAENIPQQIGESLFAVTQYACESGINPISAPFVAYHGMNGHNVDIEIGFAFGKRQEGKGNIQASEIPGGKFAMCIHVGPYDQLRSAHAALHQWVQKNGYSGTGIWYEFYLNDPQKTPPDKLETQIVFPLQ